VALLPGSRKGEIERHLPVLIEAAKKISQASQRLAPRFILAVPSANLLGANFRERISETSIQVLEGQTWDVLACAELALAASGTVTIEATLVGIPMVTFYRVNKLSWLMGKFLVRVPFYSMVNLVAGRRIVPELMQSDMTAARLADEALRLLSDGSARESMRSELELVAQKLAGPHDPLEVAASTVEEYLKEEMVHA
jgi:lipid-A-disaccharide synthase